MDEEKPIGWEKSFEYWVSCNCGGLSKFLMGTDTGWFLVGSSQSPPPRSVVLKIFFTSVIRLQVRQTLGDTLLKSTGVTDRT